jgi:para-aminobenzoate synthetase / 4-amino-4-deoxychorismate lyase
VSDSRADDEFEECRIKARFLTRLDPGFELFETMLAEPGRGVALWPRHLARLTRSARVLGFTFDPQAAQAAVEACVLGLGDASRVRLALRHDGRLAITQAALRPLAEGAVDLIVAEQRLPEASPLAAHKTTLRAQYDAGVRAAEAVGAFDSLFFDTAGRLVEGGRSSVFVRLDGRWFTPPLADGALPGVMRSVLLQDPAWAASERRLLRNDLDRAEAVVVCNALRGVLRARIKEQHAIKT